MSSCWEGAEFLALQVRLSTAALVAPMPQHWQHLKALNQPVQVRRGASVSDTFAYREVVLVSISVAVAAWH